MTRRHAALATVSVYSAAHFAVDFACVFLVFRAFADGPGLLTGALCYNFCAFAMQMPFGLLADKLNKNNYVSATGCLLVAAASMVLGAPLAAAIIAGVGNGLFHIGGGLSVLNVSGGKAGPLGIFVSPGAFGVYFGTILGKGNVPILPIVILPIVFAGIILLMNKTRVTRTVNPPFSLDGIGSPIMVTAIICLFSVVCLRSFTGLSAAFEWKSGIWVFILVIATAAGKAAGGIAADRFGAVKTAIVSLSLAAALFLFPEIPAAGVAAILLFNMTMPVTLWALAKIMPGAKGLSFGALTFGLFCGYVPAQYGLTAPGGPLFGPFLAGAAVVSLVLLLIGLRAKKR